MDFLYQKTDFMVVDAGKEYEKSGNNYIIKQNGYTMLMCGDADDRLTVGTIATDLAPEDLIQYPNKYLFKNSLFVKNPLWVKPINQEVQLLTELISSEIPKKYDSATIEKKVNKVIENWQSFFKDNRLEVTDVPADIREGILNINIPDEQLTPEQLSNKKKAINIKYKLTARYRIEAEIGDLPDQVADIDKLANMLTGMIVRMYNKLFKNIDPPADIKANYDTYTEVYTQLIDSGQYKDTSDIQDLPTLTEKQVSRRKKVVEIIEEEYFNKKN